MKSNLPKMLEELTTKQENRIAELEQALNDSRQALIDTGRFNDNSLQIISIDLILKK
jgi:hypothetical protein